MSRPEGIQSSRCDAPDAEGVGETRRHGIYNLAFPLIPTAPVILGSLETGQCNCGRQLPRLRGVVGAATDFLVCPTAAVFTPLRVI